MSTRMPAAASGATFVIGPTSPPRALVVLFTALVFSSAALMFLLEPMIAKQLLPLFGGAPAVWNTCIVFFQLALLLGYAYARIVQQLPVRRRLVLHALLVVLPLAGLPFAIDAAAAPALATHAFRSVFILLATSVGLPFFVLSTTSSVLQTWFAETMESGHEPYRLYAASNAGSLSALLAYPVVVEPLLRLRTQAGLWSASYAAFAAMTILCAAIVWRRLPSARGVPIRRVRVRLRVSWPQRLRWAALAAVPSGLMLAVTNYMSTDIAAVPLLWIVPLSLYLLTFIVAFGAPSPRVLAIADRAFAWFMIVLTLFLVVQIGGPLWFVMPVHLLAFAAAALVCHAQLAASRPPSAELTDFYLWIGIGGAAGGMFVTLFAPLAFKEIVEYPMLLVLALACRSTLDDLRPQTRARAILPIAAVALAFPLAWYANAKQLEGRAMVAAFGLLAFACYTQSRRAWRYALLIAGLLLAGRLYDPTLGRTLFADRTFFGVYRAASDRSGRFHSLMHGTTLHGIQRMDPLSIEPLSYYTRGGPIGQLFTAMPRLSSAPAIAVVGLGVGSLAAYAREGQQWTFYEIDPVVESIARSDRLFTYLTACGARCRVVLGDARLSLASAVSEPYALMIVDAFSSDAIPVHLVTSEAVTVYTRRLAPHGLLAFHISNRHLALGPVIARLAREHGMAALQQQHHASAADLTAGRNDSDWVVMGALDDLGPLVGDARWHAPAITPSTPLWTDDFSNIVRILKW